MRSHFFAYLSRMRFIQRWALMRNTAPENVQEHSHQVAVLAHALAVIRNEKFGGQVDPGAVAVAVFLPELKENLIFLFIGGMIVTSFVEYITGRLMEKILHKKWWDYSDQKLHLSAGICFMGRVQCTDDLLPESVFLRSCQYDTPFDRRSDLMGAFRPAYCGWSRFGNCGS